MLAESASSCERGRELSTSVSISMGAAVANRVQSVRTSLRLESSDKVLFPVEQDVACMSPIVKNVVERGHIDSPIPVRLVNGKTLEKVVEYCTYHARADRAGTPNAQISAWDAQFLTVDVDSLNRLFWAADVMEIQKLRDLTSEILRQLFKDMPDEDIPDPEGRTLLDKFYRK